MPTSLPLIELIYRIEPGAVRLIDVGRHGEI